MEKEARKEPPAVQGDLPSTVECACLCVRMVGPVALDSEGKSAPRVGGWRAFPVSDVCLFALAALVFRHCLHSPRVCIVAANSTLRSVAAIVF